MKVRFLRSAKVELILLFLNWIVMTMDLCVAERNESCNLVTPCIPSFGTLFILV